MGTRRLNPKARRHLLTLHPEAPAHGWRDGGGRPFNGRWAIQRQPDAHNRAGTVRHFFNAQERDTWVRANPQRREAIGKRNANVKAYRRRAGED